MTLSESGFHGGVVCDGPASQSCILVVVDVKDGLVSAHRSQSEDNGIAL